MNIRHPFVVVFHRGFKRQRPGTRSSVRVLRQRHGPSCDKLKTYRPHWVVRQHPGKNWRRTSPIGSVGGRRLTVCATALTKPFQICQNRDAYKVGEIGSPLSLSRSHFSPLPLIRGRTSTTGCCCAERAFGNRRSAVDQVPAGLPGIPEFPAPPGEGPSPGTAGC